MAFDYVGHAKALVEQARYVNFNHIVIHYRIQVEFEIARDMVADGEYNVVGDRMQPITSEQLVRSCISDDDLNGHSQHQAAVDIVNQYYGQQLHAINDAIAKYNNIG